MTTLQFTTPPGSLLDLGGQWTLGVVTYDASGYLSSAVTPTVTVTLPDGTSATPTVAAGTSTGLWLATYTPLVAGRFLARAHTTEDADVIAAYVAGPTTSGGMPTVNDVATYLRSSAASFSTADLEDELGSETEHQQAKCGVRAIYPKPLRRALLRRVQRACAMRALPLATLQGDADGGALILPGNDPEVRRLEGPYRRMVTG